MKKILCIILSLLMVFSLSACGKDEDQPENPVSNAVSEESWIDRQFAQAEELYAWFTGCNKPACDTASVKEEAGTAYVRVTESGLSDTASLRAKLGEQFTAEIVDELMNTMVYPDAPVFRDIDGALYYCSGAAGQVPWDIGQRTGMIISQSDTEIIYHIEVTHKYYSSTFSSACDYRLVMGEDGQWRFANFRLPALLIADQMFQSDHVEEEPENS